MFAGSLGAQELDFQATLDALQRIAAEQSDEAYARLRGEHYSAIVDWPGTDEVPPSELLQALKEAYRSYPEKARTDNYATTLEWYLLGQLDNEGRRAESLAAAEDAIEFFAEENPSCAWILLDWGMVLRDAQRFGEALEKLERSQAADDARELKNPDLALYRRIEFGAVYSELGMPDIAAEYLEKGYRESLDSADPIVCVSGLLHLLNCLIHLRDFSAVERYWKEFDELDRWELIETSFGGAGQPARLRERLGLSRIDRQFYEPGAQPDDGVEILEQLLTGDQLDFVERRRARAWLIRGHLDQGRLAEAGRQLDLARQESAEQAELPGDSYEEMLAALEARHARAKGADGDHLSRTLFETMLPAFEAMLEDWASAPLSVGGIGYLLYGRRLSIFAELALLEIAVHGEREGAERALTHLLRLQALGTLARANELPIPTRADVSRLCTGDQGILIYVPGREASLVFVIDGGETRVVRLQPAHLLQDAASDLAAAIHAELRGEDRGLDALAREAARYFLPDEVREALAGWTSVAVCGLANFGYVPIEAMPVHGTPLGAEIPVEHWPSLPVAHWLTTRSPVLEGGARQSVAFMLGDVVPDSEYFKGSADAYLERGSAVIGELSLEALASPLFLNSGVAEIVTHGTYDATRVRPAGLAVDTSSSSELFADDFDRLANAGLFPRIVCLTACGVGRSMLRRGDDGRGHWSGTFFQGGSDAVLVSAVDLELRASRDFMDRVHDGLAAGHTLTSAVAQARREATPEAFGVQPIHSMLLQLHGIGATRLWPAEDSSSSRWLWIALAPALTLGLVLLWRRKRAPRAGRAA